MCDNFRGMFACWRCWIKAPFRERRFLIGLGCIRICCTEQLRAPQPLTENQEKLYISRNTENLISKNDQKTQQHDQTFATLCLQDIGMSGCHWPMTWTKLQKLVMLRAAECCTFGQGRDFGGLFRTFRGGNQKNERQANGGRVLLNLDTFILIRLCSFVSCVPEAKTYENGQQRDNNETTTDKAIMPSSLANNPGSKQEEQTPFNAALCFESLKYSLFPVRIQCQCLQPAVIVLNRIQCPSCFCPHRRAIKLKQPNEGFWRYEMDVFEQFEYRNQLLTNMLPARAYFRKRHRFSGDSDAERPNDFGTGDRGRAKDDDIDFGFDEFE